MKKIFVFFMVLVLACMSVTLVGCQDPVNNNVSSGSITNTPSNTGFQISDIASSNGTSFYNTEDENKYLKFFILSDGDYYCMYYNGSNNPEYDFELSSETNTVSLKDINHTVIATFNYRNENGIKTLTNENSGDLIHGTFTTDNN